MIGRATGEEAREARRAQCIKNEEAEGKMKGERTEIFDSEESGVIKQKKWKIINMPIHMNHFLCKWFRPGMLQAHTLNVRWTTLINE